MGRRNFHGKVETIADACEADYIVSVKCWRCETRRTMHPYNLLTARPSLATAALDTEQKGFYCRTCRSSVSAIVSCTYAHPGDLIGM